MTIFNSDNKIYAIFFVSVYFYYVLFLKRKGISWGNKLFPRLSLHHGVVLLSRIKPLTESTVHMLNHSDISIQVKNNKFRKSYSKLLHHKSGFKTFIYMRIKL